MRGGVSGPTVQWLSKFGGLPKWKFNIIRWEIKFESSIIEKNGFVHFESFNPKTTIFC